MVPRRPAAVKATPAGRAFRPALTAAGTAPALRAEDNAQGPREKFGGEGVLPLRRSVTESSWLLDPDSPSRSF